MSDLQPYVCTFLDCSKAGKPFASRFLYSCHERHVHGLHKSCVFCEEVLSKGSRREYGRHLGRHMEEIAFMVVTKPYEDWDFYSDASSVKYKGIHNLDNTTASYDAGRDENTSYQTRRMQRVSCALCTEEKTFSRAEALQRHMRVVHPNTGGANQA